MNPSLLKYAKDGCEIYDSAKLDLEQVIEIVQKAEEEGKMTVRLHTGDPSIYGAIREQMDELDKLGTGYDVTPGVSSFCGAAAALNMEYTVPGVTQSVIITRMEKRTPVPERESVEELSKHGATMVFFLSAGDTEALSRRLTEAGVAKDTPAAIVYKATWDDEKKFVTDVEDLPRVVAENGINKTALIIVGNSVKQADYEKSKLYSPDFTTGFRKGRNTND